MAINKILVPVDFSSRSAPALRWAFQVARLSGASIEVLHVVPPEPRLKLALEAYMGRPIRGVETATVERAEAELESLVDSVPHEGLTIGRRVEPGEAAATIVELATEDRHDLIVMSTRGAVGLKELALGSVAHRVVTCAPCPVLTLRENNQM
jgi:nucleotide-binding universal stress UspA family protein